MDKYLYEARDKSGKVIKGMIEADTPEAVEDVLRFNKLTPITIKPFLTTEEKITSFFRQFFGRIKAGEKAVFARQLATMINAGLPLMDSLRSLVRQTPNKNLVVIILRIIAQIEKGKTFSYALSQFPDVFSPIFVSMVKSGEASGRMDQVLKELADQLESDYALRSKIRGAMIYPIFILCALGGVGIFAIVYIIPSLEEVFTGAGAQLPFMTQMLIGLSHFLQRYWYAAILVVVGVFVGIRYYFLTEAGRLTQSYLLLKVPVFGKINRGIYITQFAKTLGLLLGGGVPIIKSLGMVSDAVGNKLIERELKDAVLEVEKGVPLSTPIAKSKYMPALVASMIGVGEQTGQLDQILLKLAAIYEEETNNTLKGLTALLEPFIMLVMGLGVAFLVVSIILPIFQLSNVF